MAARIRTFDWSATPLGPIADWPPGLQIALGIVLGADDAMMLAWGPERSLLYNDAYARLMGPWHPAGLGRPFAAAWPGMWNEIAPLIARIDAGGTARIEDLPLTLDRAGRPEESWWTVSHGPVRDEAGAVAGLLGVAIDTSARVRAETALRESDARHRLLLEGWIQAMWETDAAGVVIADSPSWRAYTGQTVDEWLGYGWLDAIHPDDRADAERQWRDAIANRRRVDAEFRLRAPDGGWRWTSVRAAPMLDADGQVVRWVGANIDIDAHRRAEVALREREADLMRVQRIGRVGGLDIDVAGGLVSRRSPEFLRLHGLGPESLLETHADWRRRVHPDDVDEAERRLFDTLHGTGSRYDSEYRIIRPSDGATRWIQARADIERDGDGKATRLVGAHLDVTDQKRMQDDLRQGEARQAFLLRLSDALRPLNDPTELECAAVALLGRELGATRVFYATIDDGERSWSVTHDFRDGLPGIAGRYSLSGFQQSRLDQWRAGRASSVADSETHPHFNADERAAYAAFGARAAIGVPLVNGGRLVALLVVNQAEPREWTAAEIALTQETAERTWAAIERSRAEAALADSERWLQTLMQGVPQLVWRAVGDGHWTWASPQWTAFTGQAEADSHDWGWLDRVHPDDREQVKRIWAGAIERGAFHADYRLCCAREHRYRWFQTRATPVRGDGGAIIEWLGTSTDVDDLRGLQERQQVLVAELQHRTRNLLGLVSSTVERTGETSIDFADFRARFRDRLEALARVQGLLSRLNETDRLAFDELIRTELAAMNGDPGRATLDGPAGIRLRSSMVQTLAMAIHELATNAVKYGALGQPGGRLAISWQMVEPDRRGTPRLRIDWRESGVTMPPPGTAPQGGGQGRELIERALPYQLGAETSFALGPDGVRCTITIPVSARTAAGARTDDPPPT